MLNKGLVVALAVSIVIALTACGRAVAQLNNEGNDPFVDQDYEAALDAYERAQAESQDLAEPYYNAGNAHYRQDAYEDAEGQYQQALLNADGVLGQKSSYNLGNTLYNTQRYDEAVKAYKDALRIDPNDQDAKHNLELALTQLQQQESQEQDQADQEQEEQGQNEQQEQQQSAGEGDNQQLQQPPQPSQVQTTPLTEEQARQLLSAIGDDAETLQEHLQEVLVAPGNPSAQDW